MYDFQSISPSPNLYIRCWHAYCHSATLTNDNGVIWVAADDLLDLLSGSLSGGEVAVGVTVGVVEVQDVDRGAQARLTKHGGGVSEVP